MLIGIAFNARVVHPSVLRAGSDSVTKLWGGTEKTVSTIVRIFEPKERRQLHSVVGTYDATANYFKASTTDAFGILALISLSLGIINLFPFLPLDGGHIFWAVAE